MLFGLGKILALGSLSLVRFWLWEDLGLGKILAVEDLDCGKIQALGRFRPWEDSGLLVLFRSWTCVLAMHRQIGCQPCETVSYLKQEVLYLPTVVGK